MVDPLPPCAENVGSGAKSDGPRRALDVRVLATAPVSIDRLLLTGRQLDDAAGVFARAGIELLERPPALDAPAGPVVLGRAHAANPHTSLAPLRALLASLSRFDGHLFVGVVHRLIAPDARVRRFLGDVEGLGLPRQGALAAEQTDLGRLLGLTEHPPLALIEERPAMADRFLLAHEIGHALGLDHHPDPSNVMHPDRRPGCMPILDEDQVAPLTAR